MSNDVAVRPAVLEDAETIAEIYTESILLHDSTMDTEPFSTSDMESLIDRLTSREHIFVLEDGSGIQGWGIVKRYSDRPGYSVACETSVFLWRNQIGRGYGSRIQQRLIDFCREVDYHHIVVKIWADNESSIDFHRQFGFSMVGVQKEIGHVAGLWRDVAIMQFILSA